MSFGALMQNYFYCEKIYINTEFRSLGALIQNYFVSEYILLSKLFSILTKNDFVGV